MGGGGGGGGGGVRKGSVHRAIYLGGERTSIRGKTGRGNGLKEAKGAIT